MSVMTVKAKLAWAFAGLVFLSCAGLGVLALRFLDYPFAAAELPEAERQARAAGVPLTAQEVVRPETLAPTDLAAEGFENLLPELDSGGRLDRLRTAADLVLSDKGDRREAVQVFQGSGKDLAALRALGEKRGLGLKKDLDLSVDLLYPEFARAKSAVKILVASADIRAHRGDFRGAREDLRSATGYGRLCAEEPNLIGLLVQIAINAIALKEAERCLALALDKPAELRLIRQENLSQEPNCDLRLALRGEAYTEISVARNLDRLGGIRAFQSSSAQPLSPARVRRSGEPPGMVQRAYMARALQVWTEAFRFMDAHPGQYRAWGQKFEELGHLQSAKNGLSRMLTAIMLLVITEAGTPVLRAQADFRCKQALADAMIWRASHHSWPRTLEQAGVHVTDPFTAQPLHYRVFEGGSVRVWSVGPNLQDDGGVAQIEILGLDKSRCDVVAAYPPVVKARRRS